MYPANGLPMLACHPRDLLGLALDHSHYAGIETVDEQALRWAWANYFVKDTEDVT